MSFPSLDDSLTRFLENLTVRFLTRQNTDFVKNIAIYSKKRSQIHG